MSDVRKIFAFCAAMAGGLLILSACSPKNETVTMHVAVKLTDNDNNPIARWPLRMVVGVRDWDAPDWRGPDTGVRIVTDANGDASFTTEAIVDRRWEWQSVGFTPLSIPVRVRHVSVGFESERTLPSPHGDVVHHWFYTAEVYRWSDGSSSTYDIDRLYEAGPDGRFTRLLGMGVSSPYSVIKIDGLMLIGSGYRLADFEFDPVGDGAKEWNLKLALKQMPKPVLR
jgi:hypothetical protein